MACGTAPSRSNGAVPLGPNSATTNTPWMYVNMPKCTTKNGMRNSLPAQYAGSRGWARSSRATLNPPTTTFSNQYSSTKGNTVQPRNRTPAIGRAFARRRTSREGVSIGLARGRGLVKLPHTHSPCGGTDMKFAILIYTDRTLLDALPAGQFDAKMRDCLAHADELRQDGRLTDSQMLESATTAKSVRVRNGRRTIVDGPFTETKELLAGFNLIEAEDMDDAV